MTIERDRVRINKVLYPMLLLALPILGMTTAYADTNKAFKPSTEPAFSTPRAKPNIHMVLDDSGSMRDRDVASAVDGGNIMRTDALNRTVSALFRKYRNKAYLGVSFLWDRDNKEQGLVYLPLGDYSKLDDVDKNKRSRIEGWYDRVQDRYGRWVNEYVEGKTVNSTALEDEILYPLMNKIYASGGGTPFYRSVYEGIKMFRGQPLNESNGNNDGYQVVQNNQGEIYYNYTKSLNNPVRYRCQQNHMVVMTDGEPNTNSIYGIAKEDSQLYKNSSVGQYRDRWGTHKLSTVVTDNVYMNLYYSTGSRANENAALATILGKITANTDLRKYQSGNDDAGKPWMDDIFSTPMPIFMHTVSLFVKPDSNVYTGLTRPLGPYKKEPGLNLGFSDNGSVDDLLSAFDTIFATIIRSTSSASAVNDRTSSLLVNKSPVFDKNGNVDVKTIGTVRYDTVYDFRSYIGSVRARTSYIDPATNESKKVDLWSTDTTIKPEQGRYVTLSSATYPGQNLSDLKLNKNSILTEFQKIKPDFNNSGMEWLTNFKMNQNMNGLRERLYPLGSITSPDVVLANKDILNLNIAKDSISFDLGSQLEHWWSYKAKYQPNNLIIVGDNDGMISFIKAQRGLAEGSQAGERDTAYFPKMLVHRFSEIAEAERNSTLVLEGRTNLVDARVYQPTSAVSGDNLYATIGLTAMGGGGKGIAGYRIYAEKTDVVKTWYNNKTAFNNPNTDDIYEKVTPLFEITNEGPKNLRTVGFENLGYTYSGFEFFNRITDRGTDFGGHSTAKGQAVAVFGNGFGAEKNAAGNRPSSLYFVDAYTGQKLHEIILDPNGLGAATPSLLVSKDGITGGQKVDTIYVGDYSGTLYKVEFKGKDFTANTTKITALFKAPKTNFGQSAISVKPLVVRARNSNLYRVFFGTGIAASHEWDRYDNSLVQHSVYSITDYNKTSLQNNFALGNVTTTLTPLLTINNLKKGQVRYKNGQQPTQADYESVGEYELETVVPFADPIEDQTEKDGWYLALTADGNHSGERVVKDPQYDTENDAVIFFTWGIRERFNQYDEGMRGDPCLADFIYGKVLSFDARTGSASNGLPGLANKGKTGKAEGGLTGEWIDNSPSGNGTTSLDDVSDDLFDELVETTGKDNSAIADDPNFRKGDDSESIIQFETSATNGDGGSTSDITLGGPGEGKKPRRVSIHNLLSS